MRVYLELLDTILKTGEEKQNRTGIKALSLFGCQLRVPLVPYPLLTTKKLHMKSIVTELLWFLRGETNIEYLKRHDVTIWDPWADAQGELGPIYGAQWRRWKTQKGGSFDQISHVIETLKHNPNSRRHIVSAWNVGELDKMSLPPCHCFFQFNVTNAILSCHLYQRSVDVFLGLPFNIASYSLLTLMIAQVTKLRPGELIISTGDTHLYLNHIHQAKTQSKRLPRPLPTLKLNQDITNIFDFRVQDILLCSYHPHAHIKAPIAV